MVARGGGGWGGGGGGGQGWGWGGPPSDPPLRCQMIPRGSHGVDKASDESRLRQDRARNTGGGRRAPPVVAACATLGWPDRHGGSPAAAVATSMTRQRR